MRVLVAGIGNLFLGDDGFGPEVIRRLLARGDLPEGTRLADLLVDGSHSVGEDGSFEVPLEAYGMRWLRVVRPGDRRLV